MSTLYDEVKRANQELVEAINAADLANDDANAKLQSLNTATAESSIADKKAREANAAVDAAFERQQQAFSKIRSAPIAPATPPIGPTPGTETAP